MADLIKEMVQSLAEGTLRIVAADQAQKQFILGPAARAAGTNVAIAGGNGVRDDLRTTTGYDPVTGLTTVAFVLGVSELDGDDALSM